MAFQPRFGTIRGELRHLKSTIMDMSFELADLKILLIRNRERIQTLDDIIMSQRRNEIAILQEGLWRCTQELQEKDQYMLRNDVTIGGIPESTTISLMTIVLKIAEKLNVELEERDVVWVERLGPPPLVDENCVITRPRYIALRLVRRTQRAELLAAARNTPGATTADMGFDHVEPHRIFIYERLTRRNHLLFRRARTLAMRAKWRYVWVSNGRIFIRRAEGERERFLIRDEGDLADTGMLAIATQFNIEANQDADNDVDGAVGPADEAGDAGDNPGDNPEDNPKDNPGNRPDHQPQEE